MHSSEFSMGWLHNKFDVSRHKVVQNSLNVIPIMLNSILSKYRFLVDLHMLRAFNGWYRFYTPLVGILVVRSISWRSPPNYMHAYATVGCVRCCPPTDKQDGPLKHTYPSEDDAQLWQSIRYLCALKGSSFYVEIYKISNVRPQISWTQYRNTFESTGNAFTLQSTKQIQFLGS